MAFAHLPAGRQVDESKVMRQNRRSKAMMSVMRKRLRKR